MSIANWNTDPANLEVVMLLPDSGIEVRDRKLPDFPPRYAGYIARTTDKNSTVIFPSVNAVRVKTDASIFGSQKITITVMNKVLESGE